MCSHTRCSRVFVMVHCVRCRQLLASSSQNNKNNENKENGGYRLPAARGAVTVLNIALESRRSTSTASSLIPVRLRIVRQEAVDASLQLSYTRSFDLARCLAKEPPLGMPPHGTCAAWLTLRCLEAMT